MTSISLKTERLLLRRWRAEDVEPFAAMCADPKVMQFIGSGATRSLEQTEKSIEVFERQWEEKGFGLFAIEVLDESAFIGFTGLSEPSFLPEIMPAVEIGWRLSREHWGQGYATEAAREALEFGLKDLDLPDIVSIFQIENEASRNVIVKLGMHFDRRTNDPTCDRVVEVYRKSAEHHEGKAKTR
ncbi:GNAT family N-acetyltransferase [Pontixanthobacter sp.]|uniref:GNAT family N-acetyltransferase n=1 Tax=Pontixanthobacter sp. TaxID=2792078 RepID=UPI003C7A51AE